MCGIVGYIGAKNCIDILLNGLKMLEYRGYDSAGITVFHAHQIKILKKKGKLENLVSLVKKSNLKGKTGIGHTRWATHGKPSDINSHPHTSKNNKFAVVHNGIIENFVELKKNLLKKGYKFKSETDTEVIVHLIDDNYNGNFLKTVLKVLKLLKGSYALAMMSAKEPDKIIVARSGSPLVVGVGKNENFIASDIPALLNFTKNVIFLDEEEIAVVTRKLVKVYDLDGKEQHKATTNIAWDNIISEKKNFKHFMLKEIFEQPEAIQNTLADKVNFGTGQISFKDINIRDSDIKKVKRLFFIACGTAYHACLVGKYMMEEYCSMPIEVSIASEFRYRNVYISKDDIVVTVSQSGETADTLEAIRKSKKNGATVISICNVIGSTITRESDGIIYTDAGVEIGVASTKAFTTQLTVMYLLSLYFAKIRGRLKDNEIKKLLLELKKIPNLVREVLKTKSYIKEIAHKLHNSKNYLFLGRHFNFPIALEGALKLKEISYIHAEGYASGEMKHGPIALIDENMPVVTVAADSTISDKVISNIEEVKARDGIIIAVTNKGNKKINKLAQYTITVPKTIESLSTIINVVPLQLLAYETADWLGCDIDQPRNLAKSVTVE